MTMSTSLKLTKKLSFEGKINLKDFYRIIEINEKSLRWKGEAETLAGFIEISGNFPVKGQKISFQIVCLIETVDKTYKTDKSNGWCLIWSAIKLFFF
jgi:hypothetical protein